ncbi:MAG: hypothetical protein M1834_001460 [Cirrosporium novae-zelandiae]|nr:MAG: hypothetical protein M1834_001460 [Cirrosporium novae-zelandiae]
MSLKTVIPSQPALNAPNPLASRLNSITPNINTQFAVPQRTNLMRLQPSPTTYQSPTSEQILAAVIASSTLSTPLITPTKGQKSTMENILDHNYMALQNDGINDKETADAHAQPENGREILSGSELEPLTFQDVPIKEYTGIYKFCADDDDFGDGAWSRVRPAWEIMRFGPESKAKNLPTPPTTPTSSYEHKATGHMKLLAIKIPLRRDAPDVMANEARILSYLHRDRESANYIAPFHGFISDDHRLVYDAIPLTLHAYALNAAATALDNNSLSFWDPIIGLDAWKSLTRDLVSGLAFLHHMHCVHGDIKPRNILLAPIDESPSDPTSTEPRFRPVYCDFSSSYVSLPPAYPPPPPVSAITEDFASPELLSSFYSTAIGHDISLNNTPTATKAADIYALGMTLLIAATGSSPYADAKNQFQKLEMVKLGRPLIFAREGIQGIRARKGGIVTEWVKGSVRPVDGSVRRLNVDEWLQVVREE